MASGSSQREFAAFLRSPIEGDHDIVVLGDDVPERYRRDWTKLPAVTPIALARPRTANQVSAILRACNAAGVPVVPQGGMTGLVGGAHPQSDGIALSLDRMQGIEEIDPAAGTITVLAGTTLAAVQTAATDVGLYFPLDLGARGSCTIGGNLATNAGGNRVIRYGMTREQVLGIEVVLADGTIVSSLNKLLKNNAGYDLKQLFIGSEGTLGIITRAVLRLQPKPITTANAMCAVTSIDALATLLGALRARLGPALTAFEAMWPEFYDFMTSRLKDVNPPFDAQYGAYALVEMSGFDPGRDENRLENCLGELLDSGVLADAVVAKTGREVNELWRIREGVAELRTMLGPVTSFDIGLRLVASGDFVRAAERRIRAAWPDAIYLAYGHLGDNNLHLVVYVPSAGISQPASEISAMVYDTVRQADGTISAEHGIGLTKKPYLGFSRSTEEIDLMRRMKHALDPRGILNPGKVLG